jgi:hypothetical protein
MQRALDDKRHVAAFLRAILEATVYAHVPRSDDSGRIRLIQFTRPDGITVIPFFSELEQAETAVGNAAKVIALSGRDLFEATRGATLMLNPNEVSCTLFPEEIVALLDRNEVAVINREVTTEERQILVSVPFRPPQWLTVGASNVLRTFAGVTSAYLVEVREAETPGDETLVIAIGVGPVLAERVARAVVTAIQPRCVAERLPVDVTVFDPEQPVPAWLRSDEIQAFYVRNTG